MTDAMTDRGPRSEAKIAEVIEACRRYGDRSIIALSGVPGTGKSFLGSIAGQRFAGDPLLVREIQFHPSFTYEEFVEGMRIGSEGGFSVTDGVFLEWNQQSLDDPTQRYVLFIEELTRTNLSAVLGELLTYVEDRERQFFTIYSRRPVKVSPRLTIIATFNPVDRSAIDLDAALIRRLRIISFPPDEEQLNEMLSATALPTAVVEKVMELFTTCRSKHPADYEHLMPFGHGIFAEVREESDLHALWHQRIRYLLWRPGIRPHAFTKVIEDAYPWRDEGYRVPLPPPPKQPEPGQSPPEAPARQQPESQP